MNPCCKLSLFQGARYIAIAEFIYAVLASIFTTFELISTSNNGIAIKNRNVPVYDTYIPQVLISYLILSIIDVVISLLLYVGITTDNINKTKSYVLISTFTSVIGFGTLIYHGYHLTELSMSLVNAEFIISLTYHVYKPYGLAVIICFVIELDRLLQQDDETNATKRLKYESLDSNEEPYGVHTAAAYIFYGIPFTSLQHVHLDRIQIDYDSCVEYNDSTSNLKGTLLDINSRKTNVIVKTLKSSYRTEHHLTELLKEAKLMFQIGLHENIVKILAIHCEMPPDDMSKRANAYVVFENHGVRRLDDFLRKTFENRLQNFQNLVTHKDLSRVNPRSKRMGTVYENLESIYTHQLEPFSSDNMIQWAYQIACALEYLHSKNIIFGNLQAKCLVLDKISNVKLSSFSFASELHDNNNTITSLYTPGKISWRWTALECLISTNQGLPIRFSEKTDVWAYGSTLFEIFSMGHPPNVCSNLSEYISALVKGKRPDKPQFSTNGIYKIMRTCWDTNPSVRPGFNVLSLFFRQLLSTSIYEIE